MSRETQRQCAERMTAQEYFFYSGKRYVHSSWCDPKLHTMKIEEVLCTECNYVPRYESTHPHRAFRAHIKKHHPKTWYTEYAKQYVIQEEPDFDADAELSALRALLHA